MPAPMVPLAAAAVAVGVVVKSGAEEALVVLVICAVKDCNDNSVVLKKVFSAMRTAGTDEIRPRRLSVLRPVSWLRIRSYWKLRRRCSSSDGCCWVVIVIIEDDDDDIMRIKSLFWRG